MSLMAIDPSPPPADQATPPEELENAKNLVITLPGVSSAGFAKSHGRWALKVWPKPGEELLKPVIEALSKGHPVLYEGDQLRMTGTRLSLRRLLEDYLEGVKRRPEVATLFAFLLIALLTGLVV